MIRAPFWLCVVLVSVTALIPATAAPPKEASELVQKLEAITDGEDYAQASWGILVVDAKTGETVYERNSEKMFAPASVTKLFTCAGAIIALGQDWKAETTVYQRGTVKDGVLDGDLILVAGGDLTMGGRTKDGKTLFKDKDHTYANGGFGDAELTDTDPLAGLDELAKQVKHTGITKVEGEILIDDRLFNRSRSSGSGPDAVSSIMVNDNILDLVITPGKKAGDPATVKIRPDTAFFQVDALVTTGEKDSSTTIRLLPVAPNHFAVRGTVPVDGEPQVRIYPVDEPAYYARTLFIEALRRAGIAATTSVLRPMQNDLPASDEYSKLKSVAVLESPPLKDMLKVTLKVSHNLYASTLPCLVAVKHGGKSAEDGLREERKILKELGVNVEQVSFGGGAGGAPSDHVTPRATVQLLQGMAKRKEWKAYKAALPVIGVDGTLATVVDNDSPVRGKVSAKTGTLIWYDAANSRFFLKSKALAGTLTTKSGKELYFAIFLNNVPLPAGVSSTRDGKTLGKLCEVLHTHGP